MSYNSLPTKNAIFRLFKFFKLTTDLIRNTNQ